VKKLRCYWSTYQRKDLPVIDNIERLEAELEKVYDNDMGKTLKRNDVLRLERALYYLQSSRKMVAYNWQKRAIDEAQRGMELVKLYHLNKADS